MRFRLMWGIVSQIAIIGAGISGLSLGYYLSGTHEVTVFERERRIGGHTNTVAVETGRGELAVDTGFIVHNEKTYPGFCSLMRELGVETQASDMSFGVASADGSFEYSSRGLAGYFAQHSNVFSPAHYALLREILRFNREAPALLNRADAGALTLGEFLQQGRYQQAFIERYLYPMAAAVWSMSPGQISAFPAVTLVRFFANHGMLGLNTHPQWKTIRGGSNKYLAPLTTPIAERIHLGARIERICRRDQGVELRLSGGDVAHFDEVAFACHGDQILPLLADATPIERSVLGSFRSSRNATCLHTDERMLPRRPAARASWNYRLGQPQEPVTVTYHMNRLQRLQLDGRAVDGVDKDYCVSLNANPNHGIRSETVLRDMVYEHPVYDAAAVAAQARWGEISGRRFRTHYCGAYWAYGFHEDGVQSARRVAQALGVRA